MTEATVTTVTTESGEKIETTLPPEKVKDLQAPEPVAPAPEPAKPDAQPASPKTEEPVPAKTDPAPTEPEKDPVRDDQGKFKPKPKPIASLLSKKYEAEQRAEAAEKRAQELEAQLKTAATQPTTPADITAIMEKYGVDEANRGFITDLVAAIKAGQPGVPKEVQDLIAQQKVSNAEQAELKAFNNDVAALAKTFDAEPLTDQKVIEKLQALAYSEEKAPDGQPYFQKPLHELYFKYVKPEIEPGKPSAESSRGGAGPTKEVVDFQAIFDRDDPKDVDAMSPEQFRAYNKWMTEKQGDLPIRHKQ